MFITDEKLAHSVCLLLIELHLCTQEHKKALTLINCIENQFVNSKSEQKEGDKKEQKVISDKDCLFVY